MSTDLNHSSTYRYLHSFTLPILILMSSTKIVFIPFFLFFYVSTFAQPVEYEGMKSKEKTIQRIASDCSDPTSSELLDINNVRAIILGGNDMWWDLSAAVYEIPKISDPTEQRRSSLFAGSVWVGGVDAGNVLKVAAQTYRQSQGLAVGFWPGPLVNGDGTTDRFTCSRFDKHWKIDRSDIDQHRANTESDGSDGFILKSGYTPPKNFIDWPAHPDPAWKHPSDMLAPFIDINDNGLYEPLKGDYPDIFGDQSIWFVTNDRGNVAGSGSTPIGMEIQTQAFAYVSNDELNNMTFYNNKIINRSTIRLDSCFMSQWVDPALGWGFDDYIAVDVPRGLGISFNGDEFDNTLIGYGENPPSVGVDFFEGPFSDPNDGIDNDRDCLVDEIDVFGCDEEAKTERMIMSKFMYFINGAAFPLRDPANAAQAYNFMIGRWADGIPLTYGGNGRGGTQVSEMAFPGISDTTGWSVKGDCANPVRGLNEWSEFGEGNTPGDRRFVQSGGPFTLEPGAVNFITIGVVWARTTSGGPRGSLNLLLQADTKAQALFENCFKVLNGPDAPNLEIVELDKELIINMVNESSSNNYKLGFEEIDPVIKALNASDSTLRYDESYNFQGILLYQLSSSSVSTGELENLDRARLVYQSDLKDNTSRTPNYETDVKSGIDFVKILPEEANNNGVELSIRLTQDAFTGKSLINNRSYHYMAVAYGNNQYLTYDPVTRTGNPKPYLAGRRNVILTTGIPHKTDPDFGGLNMKSAFGTGVPVKRVEGKGNGGNPVEFTEISIEELLEPPYVAEEPIYKAGAAPFKIYVNDPKKVKGIEDYRLYFYEDEPGQDGIIDEDSRWYIVYNGNNDTIYSDSTISYGAEQILLTRKGENLGLTIEVANAQDPGVEPEGDNGFISAEIEYSETGLDWLALLGDTDIPGAQHNWILSGSVDDGNPISGDPNEIYEGILGGTFAPYRFTGWGLNNPALAGINSNQIPLASLTSQLRLMHSIDLVFTKDESKWSRCIVIESGDDDQTNEGNQLRNRIRVHPSIDKNGRDNSTSSNDVGLGWFPGYAIDLESGERLNICFGEQSADVANNGLDLLWNPTSDTRLLPANRGGLIESWGGRHHLYIMRSRYDEGEEYQNILTKNLTSPYIVNSLDPSLRNFYGEVMWVCMPALLPGASLLQTELTIKIRASSEYEKGINPKTNPENFNNPYFSFSTIGLEAETGNTEVAKSALDLIRVVPNPYYAYSDKENSQLNFSIAVINLPQRCEVRIYDLSGRLIRHLSKDDPGTAMNWDLKNHKRVPIAGGTYIFHVDAGDLGEKAVKWFGVLRPVDFSSF